FASVHRPRHVGMKRNENNTATTTAVALATTNNGNTAAIMHMGNNAMAMQRPSYQQYQQQRRIQFQQQQQQQHQQLQKQMHLQQPYQVVNVGNVQMSAQQQQQQKLQKLKGSTYELNFQQQPSPSSLHHPQQQQQQQGVNHTQYLPAGIANMNSPSNRPSTGQIQQPQHSNKTRIPIQHQKMTPPHQQQQQQQLQHQQHQQQATFNQISKNATNLLNDIYERNLLSHTTFQENEQHQQQQHLQFAIHQQQQLQQKTLNRAQIPLHNQLQNSGQIWLHKTPKAQIHSMKLPTPPAQTAVTQQQTATYQLSDSYVDPVDTKKHFLFDAHNHQPPPPPAPLNHVYETIKERPPMPPPPPERNQNMNNPPPLPPSRLLKKKLMAAAANNHSNTSKSHKSHKKSAHDKDLDKKPHNSKMLHIQPPAYVAPPPLLANGTNKTPSQYPYSLQQRTKADGEHRSILYQQLREQNQKQQQQQQNKTPTTNEVNEKVQQLPAGSSCINKHVAIKQQHPQYSQQQHQCTREHPLGAHDENHMQAPPLPTQNANNNIPSTHTSTATSNPECMMNITLDEHDAPLSVEHTLQQAGLLPQSSTNSVSVNGNNNNVSNNNINSNNNRNNRPSALPIVFEEDTGEFQDVLVLEQDGTAKLPYRHGKKIEVSLETAQAMAAAAYYARAAQKLAQSTSTKSSARTSDMTNTSARNGGFCGALQRAPPPMPPGLARRLANKENYGIGKVKVMLRVADTHTDLEQPHFMTVDKKKRQVTLTDPAAASNVAASTSQERGPMVAAPKMFAFDSLFTAEDQQSDVCASALSEVIPAVLEGSDGCLLTIGYPSSGQSKTMLGGVNPPTELGAIPCAISWLYKGINERRQKSGARFSVRVSALGVSATKPDSTSKDLLAAHATDSDDSPGVYLRDDFLGGPTELRAPTAERAALFLDAALAGRPQGGLEPAMIFTLHVYQYSLSRKGGVAGGRSRLHLIDLGGCANRSGGLPLSGIGNILLAILSGQRHPPNKDHPLTPLLKDCLAPLTCHVAIMAHVMHTQSHTDALTTIQLASRIHRMRRRKHRFPMGGDKSGVGGLANGMNAGHQSTGSSAGSGADPSSSELSADTVIYMGPSDDATDGEHPPVYLPSLSCGDQRGVMSKALKGSGVEKQQPSPSKIPGSAKKVVAQKTPQSPVVAAGRTGSLKRTTHANSPTTQGNTASATQPICEQPQFYSPVHSVKTLPNSASSPKIVAGALRHPGMTMMCTKASNVPSPKGSPLRRPGVGGVAAATNEAGECPGSPMRKITEEQWIDGPRVSRAKVAEARHLMREVNHIKQCETWIDGPKSQSSRSLTAGNLPIAASQVQGYGFMDSHKKSMIRQWVEYQTSQVFQTASAGSSPTHTHREQQAQHLRNITYHMSQLKQKSLDNPEDLYATSTRQQQHNTGDQHSLRSSQLELVNPIGPGLINNMDTTNSSAPAEIREAHHYRQNSGHSQPPLSSHLTHNETYINEETDLHSIHSHANNLYGSLGHHHAPHIPTTSASDTNLPTDRQGDCDEDQDSGPSEVPPALPLIEPLGSREISHESLHRILSRHVSRESLYQQQQHEIRRQEEQLVHRQLSRQSSHHYSQQSMQMSDCGMQVTEEEIARTMGVGEHPLAALSHVENMSIVSSFNMAGDAFSDCAMGERTRNQFDQLARLREIFTSQLAMAEVTPVFRSGCDVGSVYSEPAYRFNTGPGSVCSEPPYRSPSPRQPSRSPSQGSLPSLNGIMQIAGMEQYASLRHPDGASDPNLPKVEKPFVLEHEDICEVDEKSALLSPSKRSSLENEEEHDDVVLTQLNTSLPITNQSQLPLLPLNTSSEAYDSGHDSSTPRTSKHSGISRRAESGYHSVATARDSDESSFTSGLSKEHHNRITVKKKRQDKGLCTWLINPFTCTYPETEGEISDF
ncbi:hypothetical protein FF38_14309, partial [Lucilia cuprina]